MKNDNELSDKIVEGLKKAYEKLLESKRRNGGKIVVMSDDRIVGRILEK